MQGEGHALHGFQPCVWLSAVKSSVTSHTHAHSAVTGRKLVRKWSAKQRIVCNAQP